MHTNNTIFYISSGYFDIPAIMGNLDFINVATFDFYTPLRNPNEADYLAPLYAPPKHSTRNPNANVASEIQYWISQQANPKQLMLGIPAYGRTWKIVKDLQDVKMPIISALDGAGPSDTKSIGTVGMMSWPEICKSVSTMSKFEDKKFGNYAIRGKAVKDEHGLLITYENAASITEKALYVQNGELGGMALFDLSMDDFRGQCDGDKYTLLKTIRYRLI